LIVRTCLNYGIDHSCHLGGHRSQGFAVAVRVARVGAEISFVLIAEGVLVHPHGALAGHPEDHPQSFIAAFGKSFAALALPRLVLGQVQSAVLQKLAVMPEAAQIAGLGQNRQGHDGGDPGQSL